MMGFTEENVILQREDHQLASIKIEELSEADQDFLASDEARLAAEQMRSGNQTWTTRGGITIIGKVVDYVSREVTIKRKRGKLYVNGRVFDNLPRVYQLVTPKIVAYFEKNKVADKDSLEKWLSHRNGNPEVSYQCDGVMFEFENGDEYAIPFFLLSDEDLAILKPDWEQWKAAHQDTMAQQNYANDLQTLAAARHQDAQVTRQIAQIQLGLQAVEAGVTSLWEVTLYPARGTRGDPLWVVVPGRDSRNATQNALNRNPGYNAGPVRRVSR